MKRRDSSQATAGPMCVRCGRTAHWHPDGSCHVFSATPKHPERALAIAVDKGAERSGATAFSVDPS